eukprot:3419871-Rhodomonas_salina.1
MDATTPFVDLPEHARSRRTQLTLLGCLNAQAHILFSLRSYRTHTFCLHARTHTLKVAARQQLATVLLRHNPARRRGGALGALGGALGGGGGGAGGGGGG